MIYAKKFIQASLKPGIHTTLTDAQDFVSPHSS